MQDEPAGRVVWCTCRANLPAHCTGKKVTGYGSALNKMSLAGKEAKCQKKVKCSRPRSRAWWPIICSASHLAENSSGMIHSVNSCSGNCPPCSSIVQRLVSLSESAPVCSARLSTGHIAFSPESRVRPRATTGHSSLVRNTASTRATLAKVRAGLQWCQSQQLGCVFASRLSSRSCRTPCTKWATPQNAGSQQHQRVW